MIEFHGKHDHEGQRDYMHAADTYMYMAMHVRYFKFSCISSSLAVLTMHAKLMHFLSLQALLGINHIFN